MYFCVLGKQDVTKFKVFSGHFKVARLAKSMI